MEVKIRCGNCGEDMAFTADHIENGGRRVVCYVKKHTCFGGCQEQANDNQFCDDCKEEKEEKDNSYIGNAWYGRRGRALVCDTCIEGIRTYPP